MAGVGRRRDRHRVERVTPSADALNGRASDQVGRGDAGDLLGGRVPETDYALAVGEEDAVRHVREHSPGVGAFLDLAVEPGAVDRDPDPRREILGEGDLVRAVCGRRGEASQRQDAE
jgi:hypothetical protein